MNPTFEVPKADVRVVRRGKGMKEEQRASLSTLSSYGYGVLATSLTL